MNVRRCDWCNDLEPDETADAMGWIHADRELSGLGDLREWDFCSSQCAAEYFALAFPRPHRYGDAPASGDQTAVK